MKLIKLDSSDLCSPGYTYYINLDSVACLQESESGGKRLWHVSLNGEDILITKEAFERIRLAMESR